MRFIALALFAGAPLAFACFFVVLVGSYWGYFDMGLAGPNGLVLFMVYGPAALIVFAGISTASWFALRRRGHWLRLAVALLLIAATTSLAFAAEVHRTSDYPTQVPGTMHDFFRWFAHRWFGQPQRPNHAMERTADRPIPRFASYERRS